MDFDALMTKISGKWKELTGAAKEQYGKLTDDDIIASEGKAEKLAGSLQARYPEKYATIEDAMNDAKNLMNDLTK